MKSHQDSINDNQEQSDQRYESRIPLLSVTLWKSESNNQDQSTKSHKHGLPIGFSCSMGKNGKKYIDEYTELVKELQDKNKELQDIESERNELRKNKTELLEEIDKANASLRNLEAQKEELTRENTNIQKLEVAHPIMVNNLLYLLGEIWHDESDLAKSIRNLATVLTANGLTLCYDYEGNPNYFLKEKSDKIQEIRLLCPALLRGKNVVVQGELFIPNV